MQTRKLQYFLTALINRVQEVEDALMSIYVYRMLDNAPGTTLDMLGFIAGESRADSDSDATYRARIKLRRIINNSSGNVEDFVNAISLFEPLTGTTELYVGDMFIFISCSPVLNVSQYTTALFQRIASAGVEVLAVIGEADALIFGDETTPADLVNGFADVAMTYGGKFATIV